jgi:hypothetical protein
MSAAGCTVLLSSHILAQVEKLADRSIIIRLGKNVQSGTLAEMRHLTRTAIEASTATPVTGLDQLPGGLGAAMNNETFAGFLEVGEADVLRGYLSLMVVMMTFIVGVFTLLSVYGCGRRRTSVGPRWCSRRRPADGPGLAPPCWPPRSARSRS